ncbi:GntR family transcriptional regulator [Mycolicibacterium parafortuitum]|uniref:Putative transcriptional regulatory protein (Probably GntR-family) [Mycobacterium tuberculosis H37Rv] n=1 Tax=Mycolicibacterium parafortuitum TaxID=39692 RepID=A0A375YDN6_MYCPF|nr:GntR family transcriptional regulator [Mycolicibacterium parafortuitum]ORB31148.1 GntR family transcriptional regulator [Mycolicibacterium parafortuitum]SRX79189.1 putative transcriptional regulatory protein (probably GntR-family) [Mycobacterium tuberculosis H37Rv] [Mycolicibacterium parafortuitum]
MPKKYGVKEKDLVVAHVVDMVLTGRLRTGDRLDRNEIAHALGLSRVPVQEAVVQLEHDGILATRYHRGAYVQRFDEYTLREHHELYGVLSGLASARAAAAADPAIVSELTAEITQMRNGCDCRQFDTHTTRFRTTINAHYAGPRLQAAIDSSQTFIPHAFWQSYLQHRDAMLPFYEVELTAIRGRDPESARKACAQWSETMARILMADLIRRGVLRG